MKARLATVLSLTGVLVAGSAAALVNTQVLNSASADGNRMQLPEATQPGGSLLPPTVPIVTAGDTATTLSADSHQAVYQVDQAGLVQLSKAGDVLSIVSIEPSSGWLVTKAENEDPYNVEVTFQSGFTEIEFHATLLFGVVGTSLEARTLPGAPVTTTGTTAGTTTGTASGTVSTVGTNSSTPSTGTTDDHHDRDDGSGDDGSGDDGGGDDDGSDDRDDDD